MNSQLPFRILDSFFIMLLLLLLVNKGTSQNYNDVAAYYLNLQNDTIKGFIKADDQYNLSRSISFKALDTELDYQTIKPKDCLGFFYGQNHLFVSHVDSITADTLFMEQLNSGPINLYAYYQINKTVYYLFKQVESRFYRLEKNDKMIVKDQKEYFHEDKKYLGILNLAMYDCDKIKSKVIKARWDKQSLIKLVDSYNNCIDPTVHRESGLKKSKINIALELGTPIFVNPGFDTYLGKYADSEYKGVYGFSLATYAKFWVMRDLSVDLGVGYSYTNLHIYGTSQNMYHHEDVHFKFHHLDIPLNLQYNLTDTKLSPFIFVHTAYSFILNHEVEIESNSDELSGSFQIENLNAVKWEYGGGIGASYDRRYFLKIEYTNTDYQRGVSKLLKNQLFAVKLGYLF